MSLYRIAYTLVRALAFVVKTCVVLFFVAIGAVVFYDAWTTSQMGALAGVFGVILALFGALCGWLGLVDFLEYKANEARWTRTAK